MMSDLARMLILWSLEWPVVTVLAEATLRVVLAIVGAFLLGWVLRGRPAALRRLVWIGALSIALVVGVAGILSALRVAVAGTGVWNAHEAGPVNMGFSAGAQWAMGIWLVPASILLIRLGMTQLHLRRVLAACTHISAAPWRHDARKIGAQMGVRRPIVLLSSSRLEAPVTVGAMRPRIVIPESFLNASSTLRKSVLWHEIAHVRRRDVVGRWLAGVTCALHWFNPLVWLAARRLRRECECASDDAVLSGGVPGSTYVRHLLALATVASPHPASFVSFSVGASELRERIESIADERDRGELHAAMQLALATLGVAMLVAVLQLGFPRPRVLFLPDSHMETGPVLENGAGGARPPVVMFMGDVVPDEEALEH